MAAKCGFISFQDYRTVSAMAALHELAAICKTHRIPLIVYFERLRPDKESELLKDVIQHARGVSVRDMAPWFEGFDAANVENSKIDRHHNAEGHRVMAEHMLADIVRYQAMASLSTIVASHK